MYTINLYYNIISNLTKYNKYILREFERQRGHDYAIRASSPAKPQPCICRGHYQPPARA